MFDLSAGEIKMPDSVSYVNLMERFRQIVKKHAKKAAVISDKIVCSYEELDIKSEQLAHRLISLISNKENLIGVCTSRNEHYVVSVI